MERHQRLFESVCLLHSSSLAKSSLNVNCVFILAGDLPSWRSGYVRELRTNKRQEMWVLRRLAAGGAELARAAA